MARDEVWVVDDKIQQVLTTHAVHLISDITLTTHRGF
jgi:hypothetical protein